MHPVSVELSNQISLAVEQYLDHLKSRRQSEFQGVSQTTTAAIEMVALMSNVISYFREDEESPGSPAIMLRGDGWSEQEVNCLQVRRLIQLVARTSNSLIRGQFNTLLMTSITRRILTIIRRVAAETRLHHNKPLLGNTFSQPASTSELDMSAHLSPFEPEASTTTAAWPAGTGGGGSSPHSPRSGGRLVRFTDPGESSHLDVAASSIVDTNVAAELPGHHSLRRAPSTRDTSLLYHHAAVGPTGSAASIASTSSAPISAGALCHPNSSSMLAFGMDLGGTMSGAAASGTSAFDFAVDLPKFYEGCISGLQEYSQEISTMAEELCERVDRQIHRGDAIITIGSSHTVCKYLLAAAERHQSFRVIVLDGAPKPSALTTSLVRELVDAGVEVQQLPDSSAFAVMNKCTKVVVGAESVLANGGMLASIGTRMLCVAAQHFAVPVLVATTTLKMSPYYPSDQLCSRLVRITKAKAQELPWNVYGPPEHVLPLPNGVWVDHQTTTAARGSPMGSPTGSSSTQTLWYHPDVKASSLVSSQVAVNCAMTEYIPPQHITLYATNDAEYTPSQCHQVMSEHYNNAD